MFRKLRLMVRGQPAAGGGQISRAGATNPMGDSRPPGSALREGKTLVAAALAHPPAWTNSLPVADPSGRAANARAIVPLPNGTSESQLDAHNGERDAAKGGQEWRSSMAPR